MREPICVRCGRPTLDGYACTPCTGRAAAQLAEIRDMVGAARDIATGQARHGGTGGSGKPGSRMPLDLGATARLDAVERELTGWARHVIETRGGGIAFPPDEDRISVLANWLDSHLEWMRHRAEVDEFLTDVEACLRVVRGLARGPAPQRYLGPCGAVDPDAIGVHASDGSLAYADDPMPTNVQPLAPCDGDVYAREGASSGRCRVCSAEWSSATRRAWLDAEARSWAYTATEIADAYPIKANTIRQWLSRGLLTTHGELSGRPLMLLGDVLDLAAGDAARREEARSRRAARVAEDERMSA